MLLKISQVTRSFLLSSELTTVFRVSADFVDKIAPYSVTHKIAGTITIAIG